MDSMTEIKKLTARPNIVLFIFLFAGLIISLLINVLMPESFRGSQAWIILIASPAAYLLITRQRPKVILPHVPVGRKIWLYVAAISFGMGVIVLFITHFFYIAFGAEVVPDAIAANDSAMLNISGVILSIIIFGVIIGFLEEVLFRGVLDGEYRKQGVPIIKYAVATGLMFGFMHSGLAQMTWAAILGIVFTFMVHYSRSIWTAIFSHSIINSLANVLNPAFYFNNHADYYAFLPTFSLILGIAAAIFIPIMIICWRKFISDNPRNDEVLVIETRSFKWTYWA